MAMFSAERASSRLFGHRDLAAMVEGGCEEAVGVGAVRRNPNLNKDERPSFHCTRSCNWADLLE